MGGKLPGAYDVAHKVGAVRKVCLHHILTDIHTVVLVVTIINPTYFCSFIRVLVVGDFTRTLILLAGRITSSGG